MLDSYCTLQYLAYDKYPCCIQVHSTFPFGLLPPHSTSLSLWFCLFACLLPSLCSSPSFSSSSCGMDGLQLSCSSWCPRRSLTRGEHRRRVKLMFYFITHIETPSVLNVIQRVNAAYPGGTAKTSTAPSQHTHLHLQYWKQSCCLF